MDSCFLVNVHLSNFLAKQVKGPRVSTWVIKFVLFFSEFLVQVRDASDLTNYFLFGLIKIATKYLLPELAGTRLTPKLCTRVAEAFVNKYGKYAGWAQTLLFIAELPSQKAILPSHFSNAKGNKSAKRKIVEENTLSDSVTDDY